MTGDLDHQTNKRVLTTLTEALEQGDAAVVVIARGGGAHPHKLQVASSMVSIWTIRQTAEYLLELAISRCEANGGDAAPKVLPHMRDALLSLQAADAAADLPVVVGRA